MSRGTATDEGRSRTALGSQREAAVIPLCSKLSAIDCVGRISSEPDSSAGRAADRAVTTLEGVARGSKSRASRSLTAQWCSSCDATDVVGGHQQRVKSECGSSCHSAVRRDQCGSRISFVYLYSAQFLSSAAIIPDSSGAQAVVENCIRSRVVSVTAQCDSVLRLWQQAMGSASQITH